MLRRLIFLASLYFIITLPVQALEVGESSPELGLRDLQGNQVQLANSKEQVTLIDFWASWCAPCKKSLAWFKELQSQYAPQGLKILAVNLDQDSKDADKLLSEISPNYQVLFDPQGVSAANFKIESMPSSVLLDQHGKVLSIFQGFGPTERARMEQELKQAFAHAD